MLNQEWASGYSTSNSITPKGSRLVINQCRISRSTRSHSEPLTSIEVPFVCFYNTDTPVVFATSFLKPPTQWNGDRDISDVFQDDSWSTERKNLFANFPPRRKVQFIEHWKLKPLYLLKHSKFTRKIFRTKCQTRVHWKAHFSFSYTGACYTFREWMEIKLLHWFFFLAAGGRV